MWIIIDIRSALMKKRSKILIDLINDKIDVKKAFQILSLLLEDIENNDIENHL